VIESGRGLVLSGERRLDGATLADHAARAATGFESLGVRRGDTVAVILRNEPAFFEATLGAQHVGAYCVPMNWHNTVDETRYILVDSGARAVVIHADLYATLHEAVPHGVPVVVVETPPEIRTAYALDAAACKVPAACTAWSEWLGKHLPRSAPPIAAPDVMLYTSGTTGRPKGVRRAAPNVDQVGVQDEVRAISFGFPRGGGSSVTVVVTGPMYHSAPNAFGLIAAREGATVVLQPRFDAAELLALIERHRVTHLQMVPVMFNRLLALPRAQREAHDLSSLRFVVHAAAPIAPDAKRRMIDWWGPIIHEYYGCTGQPGRVACRVRGMPDFTYHNDDEKRARVEAGSLVLTGDIGYLDEDGFLYLCDRASDMVISGGVNIYPAEIEVALGRLPGVADCAVFGIPDAEFGEAVHAVVQPVAGTRLDEAAVRLHLRPLLAGYKLPRSIEFRTELPREDSGKLFKRRLRDPWWSGTGRSI